MIPDLEVIDKLGEGLMGVVYSCKKNNKQYICKIERCDDYDKGLESQYKSVFNNYLITDTSPLSK